MFKQARDFSEGKAVVTVDGTTWGYTNTQGQMVLDMSFTAAEPQSFHEGFAVVYQRTSDGVKP